MGKYYCGIKKNLSMVEPSQLGGPPIFSRILGPVRTEPGFTFEIPKEDQEMLKRTFIEGRMSKTSHEDEPQNEAPTAKADPSTEKSSKLWRFKEYFHRILSLFYRGSKK